MTQSTASAPVHPHSLSVRLRALCVALACALSAIAASARAESVQCWVYDDDYSNIAGPSDAVYFAGAHSACIPDGTASGTCRKWFGCGTVGSQQWVKFRVFDDGYSNQSSAQDSIYVPGSNSACIPDGTASGTCRRWFGLASVGSRPVRCQLFNDGYSAATAHTDAIYFRTNGQVCLPDGSASGTCRKWFGRCSTI